MTSLLVVEPACGLRAVARFAPSAAGRVPDETV
jgi:hypothetical protein